MKDAMIQNAIEYIRQLFSGNADGHDAEHSLRVYRNAMQIAQAYPACDLTVVALSSLLHDVDDHKLFHTEHNANARRFLEDQSISSDVIERICETINAVSFSKNRDKRPPSLEAEIVQDADRLDAIGAIGIARTFAFGGSHGRPLRESIDHFHEKLLLMGDMMNTEEAKRIAQGRYDLMVQFLEAFEDETHIK